MKLGFGNHFVPSFCIAITLLAGSAGLAADSYWANLAGGDFTNAANWIGGVPGTADTAYFTNNASYQVDWTTSITNTSANLNHAGGTLTLNVQAANIWTLSSALTVRPPSGQTETAKVMSGTIHVGNGMTLFQGRNNSALILTNATLSINRTGNVGASLGADAGTGNQFLIAGPNAVFENQSYFYLFGIGNTLRISDGAQFRNGLNGNNFAFISDSSNCLVEIVGNSSVLTNAGNFTLAGKLNQFVVRDGAQAWLVGQPQFQAGGSYVLVTGSNSLFTTGGGVNRDFLFTDSGTPSLIVSNGGRALSYFGRLGWNNNTTGTVLVTGSGSIWTNVSTLRVGGDGWNSNAKGTLTIRDGGTVVNTDAHVGYGGASGGNAGTVLVDGGHWRSSSDANIGSQGGTGELILTNGGFAFTPTKFVVGTSLNATGTITVAGGTLVSTNAGTSGTVDLRRGSVTVSDGGTLFVNRFSLNSSTNVTVTVTVASSVFSNNIGSTTSVQLGGVNNQFIVRDGGTAILAGQPTIGGNGTVVLVTDPGSVFRTTAGISDDFLFQDDGLAPSLVISNGGRALSYLGRLGWNNNTTGTVLVTGSGSVWTNLATLRVGGDGWNSNAKGTLTIRNGGTVVNSDAHVGYGGAAGGNSGTVLVDGGNWRSASDVNVGSQNGTGALVITNAGLVVTPTTLILGTSASATGTVTVGGGTLLVTNASHTGEIDIRRGALSLSGSAAVLADRLLATNGAASALALNGGTLTLRSASTVDNGTQTTVGDGTQNAKLHLLGGTHTFANGLSITNHGTLQGAATVAAAVTVHNGGAITPGNSPGTLTINSNLTLNGLAELNFELGPHSGGVGYVGLGSNDLIVVNGNLVLDGLLNIAALPGLVPALGQTNVYRLFNYSGTLTDLGLLVNSRPPEIEAAVDTSVLNQVNLYVWIPEPSSLLYLALGGLLLRRRFRRA